MKTAIETRGKRVSAANRAGQQIDAETGRAIRAFMARVSSKYPVAEGVLFGSRAQGTHRSDSDADLAVVLKGETGSRYKVAGDMAAIAFDVMQETGVLVDPLPLWEAELHRPELGGNRTLIETIVGNGLRL